MGKILLDLNPNVSHGVPFTESGTLGTKNVDLSTAQGNAFINPASYRVGGISGGAGQYVDGTLTQRILGGTKFRVENWFSVDLASANWNYLMFATTIYDGTNLWDFYINLSSESDATKNLEYYDSGASYTNIAALTVNWVDSVRLWSYIAIDCDTATGKLTRIQWDNIVDETGYSVRTTASSIKEQIRYFIRTVPNNAQTLHLLLNRLRITQLD